MFEQMDESSNDAASGASFSPLCLLTNNNKEQRESLED